MKKLEMNKIMVLNRIELIEKYLTRLYKLKELSGGKFNLPDNFAIASYNLRSILEAVFDISGHIVTRKPNVVFDSYKDIAIKLGEQKIVPKKFAENELYKMGKYRNRLTHFYFEITSKEMYGIIQNDLGDFEIFLKYIKKLLK